MNESKRNGNNNNTIALVEKGKKNQRNEKEIQINDTSSDGPLSNNVVIIIWIIEQNCVVCCSHFVDNDGWAKNSTNSSMSWRTSRRFQSNRIGEVKASEYRHYY